MLARMIVVDQAVLIAVGLSFGIVLIGLIVSRQSEVLLA